MKKKKNCAHIQRQWSDKNESWQEANEQLQFHLDLSYTSEMGEKIP